MNSEVAEGAALGRIVGDKDGWDVGYKEGATVGTAEGESVGLVLGDAVGGMVLIVGAVLGLFVGEIEGAINQISQCYFHWICIDLQCIFKSVNISHDVLDN